MHRDPHRDAEILEQLGHVPRGDMACVADPDFLDDGEPPITEDEIPDTVPSPSHPAWSGPRSRRSMAVWPDPI